MFLVKFIAVLWIILAQTIADPEEDIEPFDWGKNQTVSLKGLYLGKTVAASSFLGKPNSHGEATEHNHDFLSEVENESPGIKGRLLSSFEREEEIPLSVLEDQDAMLYPPELIAQANKLPLEKSLQINKDGVLESPRQAWLADQAAKLFGASVLPAKPQDLGRSSEDDKVAARNFPDDPNVLNNSGVKSLADFNTEDDQDDAAEEILNNVSDSEDKANTLLTASKPLTKESEEMMQEGRLISTADENPDKIEVEGDEEAHIEAKMEGITGRFQDDLEEPKLKNSEKWNSGKSSSPKNTKNSSPENINNSSENITTSSSENRKNSSENRKKSSENRKNSSENRKTSETIKNSSEHGRHISQTSGNSTGKFPAHLRILEMSQTDELFDCSERRGTLVPISNNSKYFADARLMYTYEEGKKLCMNNDLVLAELMDLPDHWSIQGFVSSFGNSVFFNAESEKFFIGPNDLHKEGVYRRSDNGKNISFQNYHTSQPDDQNVTEDCTTVSRESKNGPVGSSDDDCSKSYHVLCMFPVNTHCFNSSKEAIQISEMEKNLTLIVNASERAYFVSNFQLSWPTAMNYCINRNMTLYNLDEVSNMGFFRSMIRWESKFLRDIPIPPVQYWTSGKFKKTHMNAEIYWYRKPYLTDSEERALPKVANHTFSGLFKWSTKKLKDAGAPYIWRRDLCLSFAFEGSPDPTPSVRNTNCDLPAYFVCVEAYDDDGVPPD